VLCVIISLPEFFAVFSISRYMVCIFVDVQTETESCVSPFKHVVGDVHTRLLYGTEVFDPPPPIFWPFGSSSHERCPVNNSHAKF